MISFVISYMISCCKQDCVVVLAPYPNNPHPVESFNIKTDFALQGDGLVWYARPQLFFNCTLCPAGAKGDRRMHKEVSLVYFSTFEPIELTPDSIMQRAGVPMLYDSASNPRLLLPALRRSLQILFASAIDTRAIRALPWLTADHCLPWLTADHCSPWLTADHCLPCLPVTADHPYHI